MPKKILFAIVLVLFVVNLSAQDAEPVYRRYTVDNGLPSSVVYHTFQDSKGYIWFATTNGVSRYDGYRFENFDLQSGLVDNDVFEIYEDYKHRIWFVPMSGKLAYYENGKIVRYKYNNKIKDHIPSTRGPVKCSFYVDSLDYVHLCLKQFGHIAISPEGVYRKYDEGQDVNLSAEERPNGKILVSDAGVKTLGYFSFKGLYQSFKIPISEMSNGRWLIPHHLFFLSAPDSSLFCGIFESVFKFKNGKIVEKRKFNQTIIWMSLDKNNNLWVAPIGGGVQCFENFDIKKKPTLNLLQDIQVTSVLADKEGAFWFSSLSDGVFYCTDIKCVTYSRDDGLADNRISSVTVNCNGVYIGYEFGFVDRMRNGTITHFEPAAEKASYASIRSVSYDSTSNNLWVCSIGNLFWINNDRVYGFLGTTPSKNYVFPKEIIKSKYGGYWIGATRGLIKYDGAKVVYESYVKKDFEGIVFDLVEDKSGVVWFCTINGLWNYSNGVFRYLGNENPLLAQSGSCLIINPVDSSLWIGTNGGGIVVMGKKKTYQITTGDGLASNAINKLYYSDNSIWVATRQGLSNILLKPGRCLIKNITNANGLPTNEVLSVCEFKGKVYAGTSKGLAVFEKGKISEDSSIPSIIITNLMVNNTQIDCSQKQVRLGYEQNALSFDFIGFVYRKEGNVHYRYRMIGVDTSWVQTTTPNCLYNGLASGTYRFEVEVQNYNGVWGSTPANISFVIRPPFWKTTWFLAFEALIFSLLLFIVFRIRLSAVKRRNDLMHNINLYKQQSLRQQMNPHFIFNTLNSIQLYILEKDLVSSHKYLTKFARLMRMTLDNSLNSTIPLRDEIEALRLYLELEKLRFEDKFHYTIDYGGDDSLLSYKIPTLLIQPFVENAIWHGIMLKKDSTGYVKVTLADNGKVISCIVEDNGIGRQQAHIIRQSQNREYKSRGSQITQQRMDLLSLMYKEKFNVVYEDLADNSGEPLGTKVIISIPKEIKANL